MSSLSPTMLVQHCASVLNLSLCEPFGSPVKVHLDLHRSRWPEFTSTLNWIFSIYFRNWGLRGLHPLHLSGNFLDALASLAFKLSLSV